MNKRYKILVGLFLLLLAGLVWLESSEADPINWNPSYTAIDRIPLGGFILFENLEEAFSGNLDQVNVPPYEYLNHSPAMGTYFFLNDRFVFDRDEIHDLLNWVSGGNQAFISAGHMGNHLTDTLDVSIKTYLDPERITSLPSHNLANPLLRLENPVKADHNLPARYFSKIDTTNHIVLGTSVFENGDEKVNFLKIPFGSGNFYLHSSPEIFSNYFMLKNQNYRYAENVLAYFSENRLLWDAYYKSGKTFYSSPLYILLNNRKLKWAYYFVLLAGLLFILFEGKRKQRPVPVREPTRNRSLEFTETISQLYLERREFHELGSRKIAHFLEYIRNQYRLDARVQDELFFKNLSSRSQNSLEDTRALFRRISNFQQQPKNSKQDFFELSKSINSFKIKNGKPGNQSE